MSLFLEIFTWLQLFYPDSVWEGDYFFEGPKKKVQIK